MYRILDHLGQFDRQGRGCERLCNLLCMRVCNRCQLAVGSFKLSRIEVTASIWPNAIADAACVGMVVQGTPAHSREFHGFLNGVQHRVSPRCARVCRVASGDVQGLPYWQAGPGYPVLPPGGGRSYVKTGEPGGVLYSRFHVEHGK